MLDFNKLNNKVAFNGTIINSVRQNYSKSTKEEYVYFVVDVDRNDYPLIYNHEKYNHFYCYASERLMGGTFLDYIRKEFKMYDKVQICGILDNMPYRVSQAKEVNFRAKNCYLSAICIIDIKHLKEKKANNDEIIIINNIRKNFGKDVNVEFDENAMKKDVYGFDDDMQLPDY